MPMCTIHPRHILTARCIGKGHVVECELHKQTYYRPSLTCWKCDHLAQLSEKKEEKGKKETKK